MAIKVGDSIPVVTLKRLGKDGPVEIDTGEFFQNRKVVLFSVPGAFTPTCSNEHLPGFVARAGELKAKGIDAIACLSVNDPWVMKAWGAAHDPEEKIDLLPDGNAAFTKALGLEQDLSGAGLGVRGKRFSMIVDNGVVASIGVEEGKGVTVSGADACLHELR
jgi:glutaredoxin/glutathione-dependent peroxiredoxin